MTYVNKTKNNHTREWGNRENYLKNVLKTHRENKQCHNPGSRVNFEMLIVMWFAAMWLLILLLFSSELHLHWGHIQTCAKLWLLSNPGLYSVDSDSRIILGFFLAEHWCCPGTDLARTSDCTHHDNAERRRKNQFTSRVLRQGHWHVDGCLFILCVRCLDWICVH